MADTPHATTDPSEPDASLAATLRRVPLFPLPNAVLFPHALLPLHIFEDRYRVMTRDILSGSRCLAIGLIAPGSSDEDAVPAVLPVAGVGEVVMAHELPDGRFNLVVRGRARVRIDQELVSDRPYRLVSATELPDVRITNPAEIADADQTLRALIGRLADAIPDGGELLREVIAAQESPAELVDGVASALIVDPVLRQRLLETRDVGQRLERVSAEVVAMTARLTGPSPAN
ncbi:MAG TPA: LON peptidase substrate-binding domain-containing protein [Polyangia bacterium]|nr:LON peptidase substrate-binding domain-containing protein [Polyangia bacterium]